ncbi:hypothetical protein KSP39_PZI020000 [Platanthera zijinensis]|uniref:Pentatricopeptide repeat-containing protein n=1 Tax=Platanthera zijinensis TaxID=2320716 RepID=A0AAP0FXJ2_9ASPA
MACRLSRFCSPAALFTGNSLRAASSCSNHSLKTLKSVRKQIPKLKFSPDSIVTHSDRRNLPSDSTASSILALLSKPSVRPHDFDSLLKDFKNKLTSELVLPILRHYKNLGRSKTVEFFSWAGFQLEFRFDDEVVEYMADFLGRRKLFDDLKCLLKTVASQRGSLSSRSIAISIRFLGKQGRIMEALSLFERMEFEFSCSPDNLVFNNVLYVLCRKDPDGKFMDTALLLFHQIGMPDKFAYSNILIGLCSSGRLENAIQFFYKMSRAHLVPTRAAANILIRQLCEHGARKDLIERVKVTSVRRPFEILVPNAGPKSSIEPAVDVFWAILELELVPSGHVINALVAELCKLEKFEKAFAILEMAGKRKVRCVEESYAIVIRELCKVCRKDEACGLFEGMLCQGFRPKLTVYNSLIQMHCKLRNVMEARKYFDVMKRRRCEPDCATYTMLIHACSSVQNWEAAYALLMEMVHMGWHPHLDLYRSVDALLVESGRDDLSLKLERKMDAQLLHAHCKAGRVDAAYEKLKAMFAKGFYPPIYAKDAFERAFRRAGKWKIACQILSEMDISAFQEK